MAGSLVLKTNIGAKNAVFDLVSTRSPHVRVVKNAWCLSSLMMAFFPRNIHWSSLFARKARENTDRVPPEHPIILPKFDKFNMAAVSVKWSIQNWTLWVCVLRHTVPEAKQIQTASSKVLPNVLAKWADVTFDHVEAHVDSFKSIRPADPGRIQDFF